MTEEIDIYEDGNIHPKSYQYVQALLDRFVEVNYETALSTVKYASEINVVYCRGQIMDIIRNNPPLATVAKYLHDGRPNYLWYSDFYFDAGREVAIQYGQYVVPDIHITPVNYKMELEKIDLPYFKELVDIISLERLCVEAEKYYTVTTEEPAPEDVAEQAAEKPQLPIEKPKRSYEPKLNNEQYALLAECIEKIRLFRRPVTAAGLKKLFNGRLAEPLQVMKQLSLVYLLDEMRTCGFIKKAWMTVAFENKDFISFRTPGQERRYGSEPHYLTMDQLKSRRTDSKRCYIDGGDEIDDTIEQMKECGTQRA